MQPRPPARGRPAIGAPEPDPFESRSQSRVRPLRAHHASASDGSRLHARLTVAGALVARTVFDAGDRIVSVEVEHREVFCDVPGDAGVPSVSAERGDHRTVGACSRAPARRETETAPLCPSATPSTSSGAGVPPSSRCAVRALTDLAHRIEKVAHDLEASEVGRVRGRAG